MNLVDMRLKKFGVGGLFDHSHGLPQEDQTTKKATALDDIEDSSTREDEDDLVTVSPDTGNDYVAADPRVEPADDEALENQEFASDLPLSSEPAENGPIFSPLNNPIAPAPVLSPRDNISPPEQTMKTTTQSADDESDLLLAELQKKIDEAIARIDQEEAAAKEQLAEQYQARRDEILAAANDIKSAAEKIAQGFEKIDKLAS